MSGPEEKKAVNSPQDKKTAVLEAVISLVMEGKSLEALTVSETAARAGIGKGTVYEYFPSKEAMTAAAVCYYMRRELTAIQGDVYKRQVLKLLDAAVLLSDLYQILKAGSSIW